MTVSHPRPLHQTGQGTVAAFRSDGKRLATTGPNGNLKIWDTTDSRRPALLSRLTGRHRILGAAWNPVAADLLATLSTEPSITIWRLLYEESPRAVVKLSSPYEFSGSIAWFHDGRHIALAGDEGSVTIWNTASRVSRTEVVADASRCLSMYTDLDDLLHIVYSDGSIGRTALSEQSRHTRARRLPAVTRAAWSATGVGLAIARQNGGVQIWKSDLRLVRTVDMAPTDVPLITWHDDNEIILVEKDARHLTVLDTRGQVLWRRSLTMTPTSVTAAGGLLAIGSNGFTPVILELDSGAPAFES